MTEGPDHLSIVSTSVLSLPPGHLAERQGPGEPWTTEPYAED